jgi:hypothetical protein
MVADRVAEPAESVRFQATDDLGEPHGLVFTGTVTHPS